MADGGLSISSLGGEINSAGAISPARALRKDPAPSVSASDAGGEVGDDSSSLKLDRAILRKIDIRLCTIAGLLCALDLIDSSIMSSASATSMPADLGLHGNRYSVAIWIFVLAQVVFKLPATIVMRLVGPPLFFTAITALFGLITLCTAYVTNWQQMIALRFLMGVSMAGIYPGLTYLISAW